MVAHGSPLQVFPGLHSSHCWQPPVEQEHEPPGAPHNKVLLRVKGCDRGSMIPEQCVLQPTGDVQFKINVQLAWATTSQGYGPGQSRTPKVKSAHMKMHRCVRGHVLTAVPKNGSGRRKMHTGVPSSSVSQSLHSLGQLESGDDGGKYGNIEYVDALHPSRVVRNVGATGGNRLWHITIRSHPLPCTYTW
jgi:hypothetical protein